MIVKPAPGLKVRHPVTKQFLPDEGIEVPDGDIFWTRVAGDGDVEISPSIPTEVLGGDKQ
ncbi:DUF2635 domain-containing protein [Burkholderia sp. IDO3]|uniref:DUF2635 domain-containing protein n=1 Tax=Burkholderia sp. IDO3 TaxID=1705310 RepID=UPI000BBA848B|nr:DUF2635 domain-containing protein [Burkholderia sp. IDO3]AXK61538.1 DUF2635 domain-containing protein [Burkholderia sp. IDO3]PCD58167.1 DUF2635 domain-containing protein [Burkholderia sp. IDO3]